MSKNIYFGLIMILTFACSPKVVTVKSPPEVKIVEKEVIKYVERRVPLSARDQKYLDDALRTDSQYNNRNWEYARQAKDLANIIARPPAIVHLDNVNFGQFEGTYNFNLRRPNMVIIHHTAQNSCEQTIRTFQLTRTQVSAHYVICRNGTIFQMLNDHLRAWHAGNGSWGNITEINSSSIGIELDNNGTEPFQEAQIQSLIKLLGHLKKSYNIPAKNFIGHSDIAPTRKNDPSTKFPWKRLAEAGFGIWYVDNPYLVVPPDFNELQALRIIGYNIDDPGAAIIAFRRHFCASESKSNTLTPTEKRILFQVYTKFM
ncbi:N-acetylmuramoyl-L-alanine amidase [Haoranjiania flava]|uniref:N-acetylmuramoyl-L-alanine amidase n=1 Tax=Haoranjiania flava TaxID=1856322 RepID=A0AAE3INM4_9BACT|nr:N-acetylmuramoyl-L-alanine amidase [Haoranjiania flava]MCU7692987.1 N-acetylmuramoyl-L-alanine amidase [Haoranjiania flava]